MIAYSKDRIVGNAITLNINVDFELTQQIIQGTVEAFDKIDKVYGVGGLDLYVDLMLSSNICAFVLKYETLFY